ncbi:ShlB/FhaC/HecB family hemolysin secretion/activation protein [Ramlibacter sp.]|uniref:ShlB/FhaC/HecB family hemolysin secretion/activation protein n=1 Tax=Ramlibacter sp. TaxID=1917967 RepID=UPI0026152509|nr:ShlB/FhaC/HecB family hemolysin secretion/activation protein [Ramlibacter sp.]
MNRCLLSLALLALCQGVSAQQPPTAGAIQVPQPPPAPRPEPEIRIEQRAAPATGPADAVRIVVNTLRLEGAVRFPEADLIALTGFRPGAELSLADLQRMAASISEYYRRNGYFVAQAYLPAQDIRDGTVTIAVSEGRLGRVQLRDQTNLSERVGQSAVAGLVPGDVLATAPVERSLLLLSDVPGVNVRSTLVPGASVGTSDLMVDVTPGERVTGSVDADNGGNRFTGQYRVGATVNVNEPFGLGDVASLRVLTSGEGLKYARLSYQMQVGVAQVGVAYSHLDYRLGREFESLGAHGTAQIASIYGRYPIVRSRNSNLYAQLAFDAKQFDDRVDAVPSDTERNSRVLMASLLGDHRDGFGGGGADSYFLTWATGELEIETPAALALDAATARTNGHFDKLSFGATRLQRLGGGPFSLYAGINGQLASRNLDVSEKMELGGMNGVRAYPEGEAYADEGYLVTLEGRMDLPPLPAAIPGRMQLVAFVDSGHVRLNRDPWLAGDNQRTLSGAGVGINWGDPGNFLVRAYYAHQLGSEPALSAPDRSGRFWIQLVKYL